MSGFTPLALFLWLPIALAVFALQPARRAVLITTIGGWLFLPMAVIGMPGLTDYSKLTATAMGALLGILFFDMASLWRFRLRWFDWPVIGYCLIPFVSASVNGGGLYAGVSSIVYQAQLWWAFYFIGRIYFGTIAAQRDLAIGIFVGGLVYVPFCLYEIRFSPQLHRMVYGYFQHEFIQTRRFGGFRPMVFMQHGLMVGLWMAAASLCGVWLWYTKSIRRLFGAPVSAWVLVLLVTTVLCRSVGVASMALIVGGVIWVSAKWRIAWVWRVFLLTYPVYLLTRMVGLTDGRWLLKIAESLPLVKERTGSLASRIMNEAVYIDRAQAKFLLGWGPDFQIYNESGKNLTTPDSMWILAAARNGFLGLAGWIYLMLAPIAGVLRAVPASRLRSPSHASTAALMGVLVLFALDCVLNAMIIPVILVAGGGLMALLQPHSQLRADLVRNQRPRETPRSSYVVGATGQR